MKVFVAGASGALGRPLVRRLLRDGHTVSGMARRPDSLAVLRKLGVEAVEGNALDRAAIHDIMGRVRPDVVIDQLTSLPESPFDLAGRLPADRHLRIEGGGNLFDAAQAHDVQRYIQQSSGFYLDAAEGLADETSLLQTGAPGTIGESARMYDELEKRVMSTPEMVGVALRYGFFYGPGTWYWPDGAFTAHLEKEEVAVIGAGNAVFSFVHVDDAASATAAALNAPGGVYNVVDDQPTTVSCWLPAFAKWVGAPAPSHLDAEKARSLFGEESVYYHNCLDGADNRKAVTTLDLRPRKLPWLTE
jgi:2-alkyl-3-oxoalkanoate reductase